MADVTVQGKVVGPGGSGAGPGTIQLSLNRPGTASGSPVNPRTESIGIDGSVSFTITPNTDVTPAGTLWMALYELSGHQTKPMAEAWDMDGTTPIDIGDIPRVE